MKVDVKNYSLQEIVSNISTGELQLPEFQRDYVWYNSDKKALFDSIFNGYPIGSLLLLEMDDQKPMFAWSSLNSIDISNANKIYEKGVKKDPPNYLILDGQQRLTTLGQIILNSADLRSYFVKTNLLFDDWVERGKFIDEKEISDWLENKISFSDFIGDGKHNENPLEKFKQKSRWVSLTVLESKTKFDTEKNNVLVDIIGKINTLENRLKANKGKLTAQNKQKIDSEILELKNWQVFFTNVFLHIFSNFFDYTIPCVIVPKEMSIQGVCKIFTSTNTRGIKLGAFDLCIATLYPQDIQLKQLFEKAMIDYPLINALDGNQKRYVLQYLALANGKNPKTASLPKNIKKDYFGQANKFWDERLIELNSAIEALDKHCGSGLVSGNDNCLSYSPILPPLSLVLNKFPINDTLTAKEKQTRIQKLRSWYFSAAISNRYGEGSDNKQERDISEDLNNDFSMIDWFRADNFDDYTPNWINEPKYAELNTSGSGAVAKAMLSILTSYKANDFWDESYIVGHQNKDDIHHIFPKAALKRKIATERNVSEEKASEIIKKEFNVDSKLNLTFLKESSNRKEIIDKDPKDYFTEILNSKNSAAEKAKFKSDLNRHLINEICLNALLENDFVAFIAERKKLFKKAFERMGVKNFSDNEIE